MDRRGRSGRRGRARLSTGIPSTLEWWAELAILIKGRGEFTPRIKVQEKDGYLCVTESEFFDRVGLGRHVEERLQEVKPGLFVAKSGITLDFTRDIPTWRYCRLKGG